MILAIQELKSELAELEKVNEFSKEYVSKSMLNIQVNIF